VTTTDLLYEVRDRIALITFNRPDVLNAVRGESYDALAECLARAEADPEVRVLVITGRGRAFCAGEDLNEIERLNGGDDGAMRRRLDQLQDLTRSLLTSGKPSIASINGVAVGFGAEVALCCDLRLAAHGARLGFTEVQRGLFGTNGSLWLLPRLIGTARARELLLLGDFVDAPRAQEWGLVHDVVDDAALPERTLAIARRLIDNAPISLALLKEGLRRSPEITLDEMLDFEVDAMLRCVGTDDAREGATAFLERRQPDYTGR
jgi:enoyl-CoA hydratase/carnithine racemase